MAYESVDQLQLALTENVFHYAKDSKKAAGRALGTIVEIITFYLVKTWGLNNSVSIERKIQEYGNPNITHNVEYSLHPIYDEITVKFPKDGNSITSYKIWKTIKKEIPEFNLAVFEKANNNLLTKDAILRNSCTIGISDNSYLIASIIEEDDNEFTVAIVEQSHKPYAIFECKRVGVEEGTKKGPQTIEKAKQGAYVARTVSSLHKIRLETGELFGVIYKGKEVLHSKSYYTLLDEVINSDDSDLLNSFILTVGVVSNHGNWFTSNDHNKELKVLNQSYDWLLFLTDQGITEFIEDLIFQPNKDYEVVRDSFLASYSESKKRNQFTKVKMNKNADFQLLRYFRDNLNKIESWFNIITNNKSTLNELKDEISILKNKDWLNILK
jgi:hypothetical protein